MYPKCYKIFSGDQPCQFGARAQHLTDPLPLSSGNDVMGDRYVLFMYIIDGHWPTGNSRQTHLETIRLESLHLELWA
jgi:hypothetical protein